MVDLSQYQRVVRFELYSIRSILWFILSPIFFDWNYLPGTKLRVFILRNFGAKIGSGCIIKPGVKIKYPWKLVLGDHVWIGERVWIDNLDKVIIGSHVCLSQGAYILTGSHDMNLVTFNLVTKSVVIEDGVWICANSIVLPGVCCGSHSVLSAGSVAKFNLNPFSVYVGNPANFVKIRSIS